MLDRNLTERVPHPRSPARAKRRAKQGHPQHMRIIPSTKAYVVGNKVVMHPKLYDDMTKAIQTEVRGWMA